MKATYWSRFPASGKTEQLVVFTQGAQAIDAGIVLISANSDSTIGELPGRVFPIDSEDS